MKRKIPDGTVPMRGRSQRKWLLLATSDRGEKEMKKKRSWLMWVARYSDAKGEELAYVLCKHKSQILDFTRNDMFYKPIKVRVTEI